MTKIQLIIFNTLAFTCLFLTTVNAQTRKNHTEKFSVNEEVNIHINTTHANVKIETWDKNEVEVTFTLEADEKVEELFKEWEFKATGNKDQVNIVSNSNHHFDGIDFDFDFDFDMNDLDLDLDMKDLNLELANLNIELSDLNLNMEQMVSDLMTGLNLEDIPNSPFGKNINFNGDKYEKNPDAYLKKLNKKHNTQVTTKDIDQWLIDLEEWSESIEMKIDNSKDLDIITLETEVSEEAKEIEKSIEKWHIKNEDKIKEMTDKIQKQVEEINFEKFEKFNDFDQEKSNIKKSIHIKLPKKAKLHLNIRYGEVTLAENLRNINADLNYASLSANIINGEKTTISTSFAPVFIKHWKDGRLNLNHCNDIKIEKASKINLTAQGTDILIGTLVNSGLIHSAYGNIEIQKLDANLTNLDLSIDYGSAILYMPSNATDLTYKGNKQSSINLPKNCKIVSDIKDGKYHIISAYHQKQNTSNTLSFKANYGTLTIK